MGRGRVRVEKQGVNGKYPQVEDSSKYVRKKRCCVGERKGSQVIVKIKLLCCMWLSPFFKRVHKRFPGFV